MRPRFLLFVLLALPILGTVTWPVAAFAAAPPELQASVDDDVVGVGDDFEVHLKAIAQGEVSGVKLSEDPHVAQLGRPSIGTFHEMNLRNGVMVQKQGVNVTFRLSAVKVGAAKLTPSITVGDVTYRATPITVRVVLPGQAPPRQQRRGQDPFGNLPDPFSGFRGLFGNPFGDPDDSARQPRSTFEIPTDPKYALPAARARGTFLHAGIDKGNAVIGEQVTLSIYQYIDLGLNRELEFNDVHDVTTSDFLRKPLMEESPNPKIVGNTRIGDHIWAVRLIRKMALFPLKAGELKIGPMSLGIAKSTGGVTDKRESETLTVHVAEPPVNGRPPGYAIGDVGQFELSGNVEPREIAHGGVASVTLELSGTGNLPASIVPAARQGVEWLAPDVKEQMGPQQNDRYGGKRTFNFVVRLTREGTIELGDVAIPFYNPDTRAYDVARASLGSVVVKAGGAADSHVASAADPLPNLPPLRLDRAPEAVPHGHLTDMRGFWFALAAPSLSFVVFAGGRVAGRRLKERIRTRNGSPDTLLKQRLQEADAAGAGTDARAADAAIARALEQAIIVKANVNVRAMATRQIATALIEHGVAEPVAQSIEELLAACEAARFAPTGSDIAVSRERWKAAQECISKLKRG
ncbi:hypothetical protein LVJ94_11985 [Pendulispora rubella]|uniref:Protein BatD n=1 Tax=Pendulispora rubella TaxID=2741070 RepID=A0ABZ2LGM6_9BACT